MIVVHVRAQTRWRKSGRTPLIRACVTQAIKTGAPAFLQDAKPHELSVVLSNDAHLRELNLTFRGYDKSTDVLSFEGRTVHDHYVGDVIISMERVAAQAARNKHALEDELALLAVHGTLHLCGFDHMNPREKAVMWLHQRHTLQNLQATGLVTRKLKLPR